MPTRLRKLKITRVAVCDQGANQDADILLFKRLDRLGKAEAEDCTCADDTAEPTCPVHGDTAALEKAERSAAGTNDLPDSAFAYISPGGTKDSSGKTVPRDLRHLPYKTASGAIDTPHLRNALARLDQTDIPAAAKASAKRKLQAAARSVGIEVGKAEGPSVGDVYPQTYAGTERCDDPTCTDPDCPVHGPAIRAERRRRQQMHKGPVAALGLHAEPDGDEAPPLDYRTRGQQYDLWECLWGKWECFCTTFYDIIGDSDEDNVPYLPILVSSIEQFGQDVQQLLVDCGVAKMFTPLLHDLHERCLESAHLAKVGAAMSGHRRQRLQDAIAALQQLLEECTPDDVPHGTQPPIDRAGVSAAQAAGLPGYMKGGRMATATAERDTVTPQELDTLRKRAESAEARVKELEPLVGQVQALESTLAKMKQTPEEQEAEYWASVPEPVRKKHEADAQEKIELRKQLDEARAEREQTVYIAKTTDFRGFGMVQKHWRILKAIDRMDDQEDREELLRLMKAAAARDATSDIYKAHGTEGRYGSNGTGESASASDQLMALAKAYMEDKGVDFFKASEAIAKSHRDLYAQATRERRAATRTTNGAD